MGNSFLDNLGLGGKTNEERKAEEAMARASAYWDQLETPELERLDPEYGEYYGQDDTVLGGVEVNPEYRASQEEQLGALRNLAERGGVDAASEANLAEIQARENANARGQREAILQNSSARGMGGSGASLLAQLDSSQDALNRQSSQDMQVRGQNQQNALNARTAAAGVGSQMENTEYGQQENRAKAQDSINKFNSAGRTDQSNLNAGISNQSDMYNTGLTQTEYGNSLGKVSGQAGQMNKQADSFQQSADRKAKQAGGLASGALKVGASIYGGPAGAVAADQALKKKEGYAEGGMVEGEAPYPGDSSLNDIVPINASPGEVVVPRSLVDGGSGQEIADFVQSPPEPEVDPDREYKLAALKHLFGRNAR